MNLFTASTNNMFTFSNEIFLDPVTGRTHIQLLCYSSEIVCDIFNFSLETEKSFQP